MSCSMQDMMELDSRGIPGVSVISEEFVTAADGWKDLHGFEAGKVYVRHPIQPLNDEEVRERADECFAEIMRAIGG